MKTIAELAAALGVERTRLYNSPGIADLPEGFVVKTGPKGGRSGIPDEKFHRAIAILAELRAKPAQLDQDDYDLEQAKAMREHYAALREKARYENEIGDLVQRSEIERLLGTAFRLVRDELLNVPKQLSADLAAMDQPFDIQAALDLALGEALAKIPETVEDALGS